MTEDEASTKICPFFTKQYVGRDDELYLEKETCIASECMMWIATGMDVAVYKVYEGKGCGYCGFNR